MQSKLRHPFLPPLFKGKDLQLPEIVGVDFFLPTPPRGRKQPLRKGCEAGRAARSLPPSLRASLPLFTGLPLPLLSLLGGASQRHIVPITTGLEPGGVKLGLVATGSRSRWINSESAPWREQCLEGDGQAGLSSSSLLHLLVGWLGCFSSPPKKNPRGSPNLKSRG